MYVKDRVDISSDHKKKLELADAEGTLIIVQTTHASEFNPCGVCSVTFSKTEIRQLREYIDKHYGVKS